MATLSNTFEGGVGGSGIAAGNSGGASGNAFDTATTGTGTTLTFDNAHPAHGTLSLNATTTGTSASVYGQWSTAWSSQSSAATIYLRTYVYLPSLFNASQRIVQCISSTNAN